MSVTGLVLPAIRTKPVQCVPYAFFWSGGTPPYKFEVANPAIGLNETITGLTDSYVLWGVNVPGGTKFAFSIYDSGGEASVQGPYTVQNGTDPTCLALHGTPTLALETIAAGTLAPERVTATSTTTQAVKINSASRRKGMKAKIVIGGSLAFAALSLLL